MRSLELRADWQVVKRWPIVRYREHGRVSIECFVHHGRRSLLDSVSDHHFDLVRTRSALPPIFQTIPPVIV
jgi:hypothetical protein